MPGQPAHDRTSASEPPLLLVDVGNTRIKFGLFRESGCAADQLPRCDTFIGLPIHDPGFWTEVRDVFRDDGHTVRAIITGSNPQQIERLVLEWPVDWPPPRMLINRALLPLAIDVDEPERVGIDRLLDAVAANVLRDEGVPAIVIDVGTATTVNAVSKGGAFIGGAILPGPELCARALHKYTAVLPEVPLDELARDVPAVIGRNTEAAIKSGLYWGHWQGVLGYCERMREPLRCPPEPLIVLTGGAAYLYHDRVPPGARYEPHLTLQGLAVTATHLFGREEAL